MNEHGMGHFWHHLLLLLLQLISATDAFHFHWGARQFLSRSHSSDSQMPMAFGSTKNNGCGALLLMQPTQRPFSPSLLLSASGSENDGVADDDDTAPPSLDDDDWRAFRAKLVLGNQEGDSSSPSSWAYDSGDVIEPGSIILAKVEPEFEYFGLDQQYFHKSVILVTYHKENEYTKGIILNRPTNLFLGDEDFVGDDGEPIIPDDKNRTESSWRIWYGGDVRGLMDEDHDAEVVCLHSIDTNLARNVSEVLMNNLMMTNCEGAIKIIDAKQAEARDFWMFAGYAGWTGGQLLAERESWYMISADSGTVWKELVRQRDEENADPRDAGLKTWSSLMQAFGKENEAKVLSESFADLTLKEWAADTILFNSTDESDDMQEGISSLDDGEAHISDMFDSFFSTSRDTLDEMVELAGYDDNGLAGSLLRGSPAENDKSPFLLSDQKFHKSSLLILQDDGQLTIGVMINHATTNSYSVALPNGRTVEIPIRYGGSSGYPDVIDQPTIFLHAKPNLKEISLGEPVGGSGYNPSKIWICSEEEAVTAITEGFASHRDFMIIEGFSIWNEKDIIEAILEGKFELVDSSFTEEIWGSLLEQASLSLDTLDRNCRLASDAWGVAGKIENPFPRCVYDSSITISELADDALRYWIEAFLLGGVVSAGGKYSSFE